VTDPNNQQRPTEPVVLDRPLALPPPLPPEVVATFGSIRKRRALLRSPAYQAHHQQLLDLTYGMQYEPAPGSAPHPSEAPPLRGPRTGLQGTGPLRPFVRVASWNIKRGIQLDRIKTFIERHPVLRHVEIWMLNEVDIGMARSGNRNVAAELARHLGLGFVYGNSYLCLDHGDARDGTPQGENHESLHGNAILSRHPLIQAENFSIQISKDKFHSSEKRLGHKKALWALVQTPLGPLPVVVLHLDAYASAAQRGAQLQDALDRVALRGLRDRVLLGGDLNTNTYDAKNVGQICLNLARKAVRGGFPHAMHHYLHPYELYERPVFRAMEREGFDYRAFNAMGRGTTRYEVETFDSESTVREQLPGFAVKVLRRKLRPWNGVAAIKVDWFFGRGLEVARDASDGSSDESSGPDPRPPGSIERPAVDGVPLSDHDPIVVDVQL